MAKITSRRPNQSHFRAWIALVCLSFRRQARARTMVWVALGLLFVGVALILVNTWQHGWSVGAARYRYPRERVSQNPFFKGNFEFREKVSFDTPGGKINFRDRTTQFGDPPMYVLYDDVGQQLSGISVMLPFAMPTQSVTAAVAGSYRAIVERSGVNRFTRAIMFSLMIGFLLPVWCLSFATEALGGELESKSMVWLLTRPLPRWSIFLAKYVALLPWALSFTLGGFGLMCQAAGAPGREAFFLFWPAILGGTLAFTSLFHLISAATKRPTVVGLVYCFFLETMLGDMPGLMKRISVSYYVRCVIFGAAEGYGIQPDKPSVYMPVGSNAAWFVLGCITVLSLTIGAWIFSRREYHDDAA